VAAVVVAAVGGRLEILALTLALSRWERELTKLNIRVTPN
jgi:hypothetical protein